jgi:hypothetical protein
MTNADGPGVAVRIFIGGGIVVRSPAIKMAVWMVVLLAVLWGLGYVMGYSGEVVPFKVG